MTRLELADHLYKVLDKVDIEGEQGTTNINNILDSKQKYNIIMTIVRAIPETPLEQVHKFHNLFKIERENTHLVHEYKHKDLMYKLILEEAIELGFGLGYTPISLYNLFIDLYNKVKLEHIEYGILETFDALLDLLFVTYGMIDRTGLDKIIYEGFTEVTNSNISKLVKYDTTKDLETIKESVAKYNKQNIPVESVDLNNGYVSIERIEDRKIMKPTTYFKPSLHKIITKFLENDR